MTSNAEWIWGPLPPLSKKSNGPLNIETLTPQVSRYVRESGQNAVDAAQDPDPEIRYRLIRVSGDDLEAFKAAADWEGYSEHIKAFATRMGRDGQKLVTALDQIDAKGELLLSRVEDYGMIGLTGPEYRELDGGVDASEADRHFSSLLMEDLATKSDEKTGGSWGIGKALYFGMSRLYTAFVNSTLHPTHPLGDQRTGRIFGRTEMGWHEVNGEYYSGQGFFGLRDSTSMGDVARSSWGDTDLARALFLDRESERPGTTILTVAFHDPETPDATIESLQDEVEDAWRRHFWPLLVRERVAVTVSCAEGHDLLEEPVRLDHTSIHPDLVDLLKRYDEGKALAEPGEGGMTPGTVVSLPIKVPVPQQSDSADDPHAPFEYDCQLVVRATDRTDGPAINQVAYVRGPEMVVKSQNMSSLDPARFDAILLAGSAVAAPGSTDLPANIDEAEAYFRSSEPPAHDDWGTGRKLSERYRGSFRKPLYDLPDQVSKALWELFEHVSVEEDDAPKELSDMLRFGSEPKDPKPQVVALSGSVQGGCWEVDFKVRVTDRAEGWWFEPRIAQIGETASKSPLTWASLESKKGSVEGFRVELPTIGTGRSYTFMLHGSTKPVAVSGPERRVQLPPERSVITVDIAKSGRPEIKS